MGLFSSKQSATQVTTSATDEARALAQGALYVEAQRPFGDHNITFGEGDIATSGTAQTLEWLQPVLIVGSVIALVWAGLRVWKGKGG